MPSKYTAPRIWKRPYTSIYNHNYKYGSSLYSTEISSIERKYNEALAKTTFRSDRPDLNLSSFLDSQLTGESARRALRTSASTDAVNDLLLSDRYRSLSSTRAKTTATTATVAEESSSRRLQHSESFDNYARAMVSMNSESAELRRSRSTTRRRRPESTIGIMSSGIVIPSTPYEESLLSRDTGHHNQSFWSEKCRELQTQIDSLVHQLSETEDKVRNESNQIKTKLSNEVTDLLLTIDDQDRQIQDLQKMTKKQAKLIGDLTLELEASQRHYTDISETLTISQKKCQNLSNEVDDIRTALEKSKTSLAKGTVSFLSTLPRPSSPPAVNN
ncbi:putative uncharacterized protein MYH16 [Oppia nitens]|uniref:putative uncharacterized protein MYH16 n=1 Tax=Oppia nitens TaxID=1686743 RepID=UPI0023DA0ADF|nr:putative uncharacterized protein MYH16 [Oppia nitens]